MKHPEFLTYRADAYGYMLTYRGSDIGGAGNLQRSPKHWKHARADRAMFAASAQREVVALRDGSGRPDMRAAIDKIDAAPVAPMSDAAFERYARTWAR